MSAAPVVAVQREFPFSKDDFRRICDLVRAQTGISLADSKHELVYGRLVRRLRHLRLGGFGEYLQRVEGGDKAELQEFCNALTTNLTSFFREQHHFEWMARHFLPEMLKRNAASRRVRIWSAGCSTGEEPYSLAIVLQEALASFRGWDVRILATDIDSNVLAHAQAGNYDADRVQRMAAPRASRWFKQGADSKYAVSDELKQLISFRQLNLIGQWPFKGPFDLIICRNVVIYFEKQTQREIFGRMAAMQRIGDYLILGHSESLLGVNTQYEMVGQTIHRRTG